MSGERKTDGAAMEAYLQRLHVCQRDVARITYSLICAEDVELDGEVWRDRLALASKLLGEVTEQMRLVEKLGDIVLANQREARR